MCREPEQIDVNREQINLDSVAQELLGDLDVAEPEPEPESSLQQSDAQLMRDPCDPPSVIVVNRNDDSQFTSERLLIPAEIHSFFQRLRLVFALLIGVTVFSVECYLFDFPEFQSEIDGNTQILGGLTAVGGFALLRKTNALWK